MAQLAIEVMEQLDVATVPFGIGRIPFGIRDMACQPVQLRRGPHWPFGKRPMHDQVRIPTDRRREMGVVLLRETEVPARNDVVARALERTQQPDAQRVPCGMLGDAVRQAPHFRAVLQVAAFDAERPDLVPVLVQPLGIRFLMHAMQRHPVHLAQTDGHGLVGQEHELLDQLVGLVIEVLLEAQHVAARIQPDLDLARTQFQRASLEARPTQPLGQQPGILDHVVELVAGRLGEDRQRLAVGVTPLRMNDGTIELGLLHPPFRCEFEFHALRQTIHPRLERAQLIAQTLGKHRNHPVHKIRRVAPLQCLVIQRRPRLHVVRHIRHMDPHAPTAAGAPLHADGIVEVLRVIRINRHHPMGPTIHPTRHVTLADTVAVRAGRIDDHLRKLLLEVVLTEHRQHVDAVRLRSAQHLHHFALGIRPPRFPLLQLHDDLVARTRLLQRTLGFGNIELVRNARIIRHHPQHTLAPMQRPDETGPAPLEHPHHGSGLHARILPDENTVFVEGSSSRGLGNGNLGRRRIVGQQPTAARAVHPESSRHQTGFLGLHIPVALDSDQPAFALLGVERGLQFRAARVRPAQLAEQRRQVRRQGSRPREQPYNRIVHFVLLQESTATHGRRSQSFWRIHSVAGSGHLVTGSSVRRRP